MALKWYILHVYSGFEARVKANLDERIAASSHPEKFGEVVGGPERIVVSLFLQIEGDLEGGGVAGGDGAAARLGADTEMRTSG